MARITNSKIKRFCNQCNKEFYIFPYILRNGGGQFCGRKCSGKSFSLKYRKENSVHWKIDNKIKLKCQQCGKNFIWLKCETRGGRGKFCCRKCFYENLTGKLKENPIGKITGNVRAMRLYGKKPCEVCKKEKSDIHHIDGNNLNNKKENIMHLCRKHHIELDNRIWNKGKTGMKYPNRKKPIEFTEKHKKNISEGLKKAHKEKKWGFISNII